MLGLAGAVLTVVGGLTVVYWLSPRRPRSQKTVFFVGFLGVIMALAGIFMIILH